ncbi:MAG TPA: hypothetical protein VFQ61_06620 [Polyangiaceae bacterium]|nr:hypothetical protein [Polyangiaceae bacterium]
MTDRYNGFSVVLEKDVRSDDAERIIDAIRCIRGVLSVTPHVQDWEGHMAEQRAREHYREQLISVLWPERANR